MRKEDNTLVIKEVVTNEKNVTFFLEAHKFHSVCLVYRVHAGKDNWPCFSRGLSGESASGQKGHFFKSPQRDARELQGSYGEEENLN